MASGIEAQNGSWRGAESTCIVSNVVIVGVVVAGECHHGCMVYGLKTCAVEQKSKQPKYSPGGVSSCSLNFFLGPPCRQKLLLGVQEKIVGKEGWALCWGVDIFNS